MSAFLIVPERIDAFFKCLSNVYPALGKYFLHCSFVPTEYHSENLLNFLVIKLYENFMHIYKKKVFMINIQVKH